MQVNYELLTTTIDPQDVLGSMFSCKLTSFEEKERILTTQDERGKRRACEKMVDMLLKSWKKGTCERFIQVLERCDYKECAESLQSNLILVTLNIRLVDTLCIQSIHAANELLMLRLSTPVYQGRDVICLV